MRDDTEVLEVTNREVTHHAKEPRRGSVDWVFANNRYCTSCVFHKGKPVPFRNIQQQQRLGREERKEKVPGKKRAGVETEISGTATAKNNN